MWIMNKKEIYLSNSLQEFNEIRGKLSSNGLKLDYKIVDQTRPNYFGRSTRARSGSYGVDMDHTKIYYIYVHKKDYDKAQTILRNTFTNL